MNPLPRHQCLIYDGSPSSHLKALAAVVRERLQQNHRCLYLNSSPMVAGMRSYLAAAGVDVAHETRKSSLVLTSELHHLVDDRHFDIDRMLGMLADTLQAALREGYDGLWCSGDMTWEFGPDGDFSKLVEYEWRLEEFFRLHPQLNGVCQYHADQLPRDVLRHGYLTHPSLFVNETLTLLNPYYLAPEKFLEAQIHNSDLESTLNRLSRNENVNRTQA